MNRVNVVVQSRDGLRVDAAQLLGSFKHAHIEADVFVVNDKAPDDLLERIQKTTTVLFGSSSDRAMSWLREMRCQLSSSKLLLIGGSEVTYGAGRLARDLDANERLILGDASTTIPEIVNQTSEGVGRAIPHVTVGQLWNPNHFVQCSNWSGGRVLWRVGCNRTCGYCPLGHTWRSIYKTPDLIRTRDTAQVVAEIRELAERRFTIVALVADQTFHENPDLNSEFLEVCQQVRASAPGLVLDIAITPFDILNNRQLICKAVELGQRLHFRVAIDFASDELLSMFKLPSRVADHVDALRLCCELRIPFDVSYIFEHPLLSARAIEDLLDLLRTIHHYFANNKLSFGFYVITRFLSSSLTCDLVVPSDEVLRLTLQRAKADSVANAFVAAIARLRAEHHSRFAALAVKASNSKRNNGIINALSALLDESQKCADGGGCGTEQFSSVLSRVTQAFFN